MAVGDPLIGQSLGQYRLVARLGRGGMGAVYRAVHATLGQERAVKVLRPDLTDDERFVRLFLREARLAAELRHPNIVLLYDVAQHGQYYYIVMELLAGQSLRQLLEASHPLALDRAVDLLGQLAAALDYAHSRGIVHRDVKPDNAFVGRGPDGREHLTLVDFGIARALDRTAHLSTSTIGTPAYMAPEVVTGATATAAADGYAVGVVAYEMLAGRPPFDEPTPGALLYAQIATPPPPLRDARPDLPPAIEAAVLRQLAKQPEGRFPSCTAFVEAIAEPARAHLTAADRTARPLDSDVRSASAAGACATSTGVDSMGAAPTLTDRPAGDRADDHHVGPIRLTRRALLLGASVAVGLGVAVGGLRWLSTAQTGSPAPGTAPAARPATAPTDAPAEPTVQSTMPVASAPPVPTATSAQPTVAPVQPTAPAKVPSAGDAIGRMEQLARWGDGNLTEAVLSPDGRLLAVASSLGIRLYAADTLQLQRFIETGEWIHSVAFAPDGQTLASASHDKTVRIWRAVDGALLRTLEGHTGWVGSVAFAPDGQTLASASSDKTVRIWRVGDGALLRTLEGHTESVDSVAFAPDGQTLASASFDKTVRIWQVTDGALLRTLEGHTGAVRSVAFARDGTLLVSGSRDGTIRLWGVR